MIVHRKPARLAVPSGNCPGRARHARRRAVVFKDPGDACTSGEVTWRVGPPPQSPLPSRGTVIRFPKIDSPRRQRLVEAAPLRPAKALPEPEGASGYGGPS